MFEYDKYNREERAICAHLFRLLHERLDDKQTSPLGRLITTLEPLNLNFHNGSSDLAKLRYENIGLFCEVAIIRDVYQNKKSNVNEFMDDLTRLIMKQEGVSNCRLYSKLDSVLNDPIKTHPKQIRQKATEEGIRFSEEEKKVYGSMQGMFNAKPDLVITIDNILFVIEAKFTEKFDDEQLERTLKIAEVWATLLYKDFGFIAPPKYAVVKLGASNYNPDINWKDILEIAKQTYGKNDRTLVAIKSGVELLKQKNLE